MGACRFILVLAVLDGCNWFYGLDTSVTVPPIDAVYYDRPDSAPASCPNDGSAPTFQKLLHPLPETECSSYTVSEVGTGLARCNGALAFGMVDQLSTIALGAGVEQATSPRLAPEGDFAIVTVPSAVPGFSDVVAIAPDMANTWQLIATLPGGPSGELHVSTPSRGPEHHVIMFDVTSGMIQELAGTSTAWTTLGSPYSPAAIGMTLITDSPSLTPDGLRLVLRGFSTSTGGVEETFYTERTDSSQPFGLVKPIAVPIAIHSVFMTGDCGRLYFSALHNTLYLTQ